MSDLQKSRAILLDEVLEKSNAEKIEWNFDGDSGSAQTANLGDFQVHIDRKLAGSKFEYKVWVFDKEMNELDSFNSSSITEYTPENDQFGSYQALARSMFEKVRDADTIRAIEPAIDKIRNL